MPATVRPLEKTAAELEAIHKGSGAKLERLALARRRLANAQAERDAKIAEVSAAETEVAAALAEANQFWGATVVAAVEIVEGE